MQDRSMNKKNDKNSIVDKDDDNDAVDHIQR